MTNPTEPGILQQMPPELRKAIEENRSRFRWVGIALIVLGLIAILFPLIASIAAKLMIGWMFLITGIVVLWHAFQSRSWKSAILSGLIGVVQMAVGVYLAFFPLTGLVALTVLMAVVFIFQGVAELMVAWQHNPNQGAGKKSWIWLMLSGAISVLLGCLLLADLPGTALWALGLVLGINLLSSGISFLTISNMAKQD